jgi:glyoxylase-like metal-dependent hydrolase (beta-lactamase superfamily II)
MTRHLICTALACLMLAPAHAETGDFCAELPRAANADLERHAASTEWFEVHEVEPGIFGILEPQQWQEVISWLVVGSKAALLIDTGNGIGDIASIVRSLTDKPVTVINTHSHYDHVGGNHQFEQVAALDSDYGRANAGGYANAAVRGEVSEEALCRPLPEGFTEDEHVIHPYAVSQWVKDGHRFDIGGRVLEVLHIPGHSPDGIALFEPASGFLWSGDTYYPGEIWLFDPATDYADYQRSMARLATLADKVTRVFPAHNVLIADPSGLVETRDAYERILRGEAQGVPDEELGVLRYDFGTIGFLVQTNHPGSQ